MDIAPFMRVGPILTWLLILAWSTSCLRAGEATTLSILPMSSVFRPQRTVAKPSKAAIFRLSTNEPSRGNIVTFVGYDSTDGTNDGGFMDDAGVAGINSFPDQDPSGQEAIRPSEPVPLRQAVPLDGVLRDDYSADDEDSAGKLPTTRTSLGWIPGTNDQFGMLELESAPLSRVVYNPDHQPVAIGGSYGARWLSGPNSTDLPPQLFNVLIDIGTIFQFNDRVKIDAMLSPGWYTDFSNKGVEAFRLPWHLVSYFQTDSDWRWVLGVTDLARDDIRYLPVVGMIYSSPESDFRLDLVFPKPRVAMKVSQTRKETQWVYISGELGGGSWAISRADRAYDVVTYRDYRLMGGLESTTFSGRAVRIEGGWVFNRSIQYRSDIGNTNPPDSAMIRISADY